MSRDLESLDDGMAQTGSRFREGSVKFGHDKQIIRLWINGTRCQKGLRNYSEYPNSFPQVRSSPLCME